MQFLHLLFKVYSSDNPIRTGFLNVDIVFIGILPHVTITLHLSGVLTKTILLSLLMPSAYFTQSTELSETKKTFLKFSQNPFIIKNDKK